MRLTDKFLVTFAALFAVLVLAGCGGDKAGSTSCTADTDCSLGEVCQVQDKECIVAGCEFCTADQICYKPTPDAAGSCSAPQCLNNDDCPDGTCREGQCATGGCVSNDECADGEVCNLVGQCEASDGTCAGDSDCPSGQVCKDDACVAGCSTNEECEDGEFCNAEQTCETGCRDSMECPSGQLCTDGACACDATSCADGKVCLDTGNCGDPTDCSQVDCGAQVCNPADLSCIDACTADSCMPNEICNTNNGLCEVNNCPGEDPNQCMGNLQRPIWDPIKCFCAECTDDTQCDQGAGETCNAAGNCFACQTTCDANTPGTCSGGTPYCINDCCVECVGAADCAMGQLCLDGFCGDPPNCQVDPTVCPTGYTCNQATGQCDPPQTGGSCDPTDPASCPSPSFCDFQTMTCQSGGGMFGCGLCAADCSCPSGFTCNGFYCASPDPLACIGCPSGEIACALATLVTGESVCLP